MSVKAMALAWDADIKPGAKLVLLAIADHADGQGVCWPGQELIAEKCGMNRSTVNQHISDLVRDGFIFVEKRRGDLGRQSTSIYRINFEVPKTGKKQHSSVGKPNMAKASSSVGKTNAGNDYSSVGNSSVGNSSVGKTSIPELGFRDSSVGNSNAYTISNEPSIEPSIEPSLFCTEAFASAQKPIIKIPLNVSGTFHEIFEADITKYSELYPAVDVLQQLRNMIGWCDANPTRRKTKGGIRRFINSWLAKDQDRGGSKSSRPQAKPHAQQEPIVYKPSAFAKQSAAIDCEHFEVI